MDRPAPGSGPARTGADGGFTIVEVMVAMLIFALVSGAVLLLVMRAADAIRGNSDRVLAAAIARSEVDALQAKGAYGATLGESTKVVSTTSGVFTVKTTATWIDLRLRTNPCQVGNGVDPGRSYVRLHVEVTGGDLGAAQTSDALLYPQDTAPSEHTGTVTAQIGDAAGVPVEGVTVTLSGGGSLAAPSQVTGPDGCVFFPDVPMSTQWTATIDKPNYITEQLNAQTKSGVVVNELENTQLLWAYSLPGTVVFASGSQSFPLPAGMPFTFTPDTRKRVPSTITSYPVTVTGLWPGTLTANLGVCSDAAALGSVSTTVAAAGVSTLTLPAAMIEVVGPADAVVTATPTASGCTAGTYQLGKIASNLLLTATLPYGEWNITVSGGGKAAYLAPTPALCSVSWTVPGALTQAQADAVMADYDDAVAAAIAAGDPVPPRPVLLVLPIVSDPCPATKASTP